MPSRFETALKGNDALRGGIALLFSEFRDILVDNKLVFFPEYTDHGLDHINEVLSTAAGVISDHAWAQITPEDVAVLTSAVLLHDLAMHLSEDGFIALVREAPVLDNRPRFSERPWHELWEEFMTEAKRFDERRLERLFGSATPVRTPPMDANQMTRLDRLLIGEFLRRHHPRLAYEFSIHGLPGPRGRRSPLKAFLPELAELAGLVARSHGMSLRAAVDRLSPHERREFRGVHAPFLMCVLRLSDYLQIHRERAPGRILELRSLRSPVSREEWDAHRSVLSISAVHDDPEAIVVHAEPTTARAFLKIRALLQDIQREVDACWAVLGEVYGRFAGLADLALTLRRIRSNTDDPIDFGRSVDYLPARFSFTTAGPGLLSLLVGPLYGHNLLVGAREVLQNALDAVREREDLQHSVVVAAEGAASVIIDFAVDEAGSWIRFTDHGVGMTAATIQNFFLRAGASFRNSEAWRRTHEDEPGKSRVLRSGRFGVGAVAPFLLGTEISVVTRHVSEPRGNSFRCKLHDELIEVKPTDCPVGTTLSILLSDAGLKALIESRHRARERWDWYCLDQPMVSRFGFDGKPIRQTFRLPACGLTPLPAGWGRAVHADFTDLQWTFEHSAPGLVCNGIRVSDSPVRFNRPTDWMDTTSGLAVAMPKLSVFDPDGCLPLDLQRAGLGGAALPFEGELHNAVLTEVLDYIGARPVTLRDGPAGIAKSLINLRHKGLRRTGGETDFCFAYGPTGITLAHSELLRSVHNGRLFVAPVSATGLPRMVEWFSTRAEWFLPLSWAEYHGGYSLRFAFADPSAKAFSTELGWAGTRLVCQTRFFDGAVSKKYLPRRAVNKIRSEVVTGTTTSLYTTGAVAGTRPIDIFPTFDGVPWVAEFSLVRGVTSNGDRTLAPLVDAWKARFGLVLSYAQ